MEYVNTTATPLLSYNDPYGNPVFRIERDGMVYLKGLLLHDGSSTNTVDIISDPAPDSVNGGQF